MPPPLFCYLRMLYYPRKYKRNFPAYTPLHIFAGYDIICAVNAREGLERQN